jgi:hypothetical protein
MSLIYSEQREPFTGAVDFHKLNAVKGYLRHYENLLYLTFMHQNGTTAEKMQAAKELTICERKLKWWQNHPNYDAKEALRGVNSLKSAWAK